MPRSQIRPVRHVAVLIDLSLSYRRGLLEGIARYSREHGTWVLYFELRGLDPAPPWLRSWKGDGILACFPSRQLGQAVLATGVPVVDLWGTVTPSEQPQVSADNVEVTRLAFEHLWELGVRQFGFCGLPHGARLYMDERKENFRRRVEAAGRPCSLFAMPLTHCSGIDWEREMEQLVDWLRSLPKPVGVLAHDDERGYQMLNACRHAGVVVPDEVAVLGVGNDTILCEMCVPPLTSIELNAPQIGYTAAARLDRLMQGRQLRRSQQTVRPRGVVARRSTDTLAIEDADVVAALRFIRDHACRGIRMQDVLGRLAISQSSLEKKFRSLLDRTPKAEILRVQMIRAGQLLADSDLPIKEVAHRCGFHKTETYFSSAFYRYYRIWPTVYRRRYRTEAGPMNK